MEIVKRSAALQAGLIRYYTGKPCAYGHTDQRNASDGRCCECARQKSNKQYWSNPIAAREAAVKIRKENPSKAREILRRSRAKNREAILKTKREYWTKNPSKRAASDSKKRAQKLHALPVWFGEFDAFVWHEAARLVQQREAATGTKWHADHMIPLLGRTASGLHVGNNCQVIPAFLNQSKNNRMIFTRPLEWLSAL